jgi:MoxR-like ATPase
MNTDMIRVSSMSIRGKESVTTCGSYRAFKSVADAADTLVESDVAAVGRLHNAYRRIAEELGRVIVGQDTVIEQLLTALFAGGHCLLIGVPGLAKTLMIRTLADCLSLRFRRIQSTPDLMPADITGTEVIQEDKATGTRALRFLPGPVFAQVVLADEINRTPPKTQAALLEAMQEHQVTIGGTAHRLDEPFFVLATQNPIEQEGTYPLPEAQLDRFMFSVLVDYPSEEEELQIVKQTTCDQPRAAAPVLAADEILSLAHIVRRVPVAEHVMRHALQLARLTRRGKNGSPDFVNEFVSWGAGPRASQYLVLAAKARAALHGRFYASTADVEALAAPVLRHRIMTNFNAEAEGVTPDEIVRRLIGRLDEHGPARPGDVSYGGEDETRGRVAPVFRSAQSG